MACNHAARGLWCHASHKRCIFPFDSFTIIPFHVAEIEVGGALSLEKIMVPAAPAV